MTRAEISDLGPIAEQALDAAPDGFLIVDPQGVIRFASRQAAVMFGYDADDLRGQSVELLVPDEVRPMHPSHRALYFDSPRTRPMGAGTELTARRRDGTEFPVDIALSSLHTDEGVFACAAIRDITDRRRAEVDRARLAAIVTSSGDAILSADVDGTITSWNPGAELLFGFAARDAVGTSVRLGVPGDRIAMEADVLASVAAGEPVLPYESSRDRADGRRLDVVVSPSPIIDPHGTVTGVAFIVRDVTASKRVEAKFQALLEAAPDAIIGVDRDGVIQLVNRQVETVFGYHREELLGQRLELLIPEGTREVHPALRTRYFDNPRTRPMGAGVQLAARRKDGSEFPVDIALSHIEAENGPIVTAAVRDISEQWAWAERERLQAQLHQSQRLESLGQLAGGIAHDFNNLLVVILNYAVFVRDTLAADGTHQEALNDIEQIHRAAERAAALTHQLLMFSRREVVKQEVLDLNTVVAELDKLLRRTIGEHIVLRTRLDSELWSIRADPSQMEQVLVNLAVNARDAMPDGGELIVETANVELDSETVIPHIGPAPEPGRYVRLTVTDSGTGMSRETIDRAFEPFFTTKPRGQGSGLGLATVYGVVTDTGGHIGVYSEIGLGTTFRIYLPMAEASPADQRVPAPQAPAVQGRGQTVLVTEDEDAVREMAERILARGGYAVRTARSGEEALAILRDPDTPVDLLLTDVVMPGMSGTELSGRAAELRAGLRTVFMSGYSQEFIGHRVLAPGTWLVEKPFTADTLLIRIREALSDG